MVQQQLPDNSALAELISRMPRGERLAYAGFSSMTLEPTFSGRSFVVYDLVRGSPTNIETFRTSEVWLPKGGELTAEIRRGDGANSLEITTVPRRYREREVFLSIPQRFYFKWAGQRSAGGVHFRPHYALLIKTSSRSDRLDDDVTYCVSKRRFNELFPNISDEELKSLTTK